jgi:NADH dehydrogenase
MNDLLDRLAKLTGREPRRVRLPFAAAFAATAAASAAGLPVTVDENLLLLLREHNVASSNALRSVLGIAPTPLGDGLRALADALPEQEAGEGVGSMRHKRYWADITGARHDAERLMAVVRDRAAELLPVEFDAEPGTPQRLEPGATLTGALPLRGHFQVRVEAVGPHRVVLATLQGHPLAGSLQFSAEELPGGVRFAVDTFTRAATVADRVAMATVGAPLQDLNWRRFVANVIEASGGEAPDGVQSSSEKLSDEEAEAREAELRELVQQRQRAATTSN